MPRFETMIKTVDEAYGFIKQKTWTDTGVGLERMRELLGALGHPERAFAVIHVAGTNGKGSVCSMLASIFTASGFKTGLLTSPHLISMNERIRIGDELIGDEAFCRVAEEVRQASLKMSEPPTEYEIITAMAFLYFKEEGTDAAVIEVGLGGELDSTNAIEKPVLTVITSIGLDHTEILGNSLTEIASAKAGIIKPKVPVVANVSDNGAYSVIEERAHSLSSPLDRVNDGDLECVSSDLHGTRFKFKGFDREFFLHLAGAYQRRNAATVMTAVRELKKAGFGITDDGIAAGLAGCSWPARFEVLSEHPAFIVDGAHNPEGVSAAVRSLMELLPEEKNGVIFICGVLADKDFPAMMKLLSPIAKKVFTLTPDSKRALDGKRLKEIAEGCGIEAESCESEKEAARKALQTAGKDGTVCFLGSLYLAGRIRETVSLL